MLELNQDDLTFLETIAKTNTTRYNKMKLVEELQELSTVLIQKETKLQKVNAKDPEAEEKEIADVLIRILMYSFILPPEKLALVSKAMATKIKRYQKWFKEGTYNQI